jgi:hypothetical protein
LGVTAFGAAALGAAFSTSFVTGFRAVALRLGGAAFLVTRRMMRTALALGAAFLAAFFAVRFAAGRARLATFRVALRAVALRELARRLGAATRLAAAIGRRRAGAFRFAIPVSSRPVMRAQPDPATPLQRLA